ncbi:MAG: hypothetical protein K8I00_08575, partial [Candidatus Omnitrophica bacterium]|nr:hypothetical protein [Candidatus Omnitrophota bacterium]
QGGGAFAPGQGQGSDRRGGQNVPGGESPTPTGEQPNPPTAPEGGGTGTGGGATAPGGGEGVTPVGGQPGGTETPSTGEAFPTQTPDSTAGEERTPPPKPTRPEPPEPVETPQDPTGEKPEPPAGPATENPPQVEITPSTQEAKDPCEGRRGFETPAPEESDAKKNLRSRMLEAARGGQQKFSEFRSSVMDDPNASNETIVAYGELMTELQQWSRDPCHGRTQAPSGTSSGSGAEAPKPTGQQPAVPSTEQPETAGATTQPAEDPCAGKRSFATPAEGESGDKRAMRNRILSSMRAGTESFRNFVQSMIGDNATGSEIEKRLFGELIQELQTWANDPCNNRQGEAIVPRRETPSAPPGTTPAGTGSEDPCQGKRTFFQSPDNESAGKKAMRARMITALRTGSEAFNELRGQVMNNSATTQADITAFGELMGELQTWANDPCHRQSGARGGASSGSGSEAPRPTATTPATPVETTRPQETTTASSETRDPCDGKRNFATPPAGENANKSDLRRRYILAARDGEETFSRFFQRNMEHGNDDTKRWLRELNDEVAQMLKDPCFNKNLSQTESPQATSTQPRPTAQGTDYFDPAGCAMSPGLINKDSCEGYCRYLNKDSGLSTACIPTLRAPNGEQCYACPGTPEATHPGQPGCPQIGKLTKVSCESICENKCEGDGKAPNTEQCWRCKADATWTQVPEQLGQPQEEKEPERTEPRPPEAPRMRDGRIVPTWQTRGQELTEEDAAKAAAMFGAMWESGAEQGGIADSNRAETQTQYDENISTQERLKAEERADWKKLQDQYAEWQRRHEEFLRQPTAYQQFLIDKSAEEKRIEKEQDELRWEVSSIQGDLLIAIKEEMKENSDVYDPTILKYISIAAEMQHETARLEGMAIRGMLYAQMKIQAIDLYMEQNAEMLEQKPYLKRYLERMRLQAQLREIQNKQTILETTLLVRVGLLADVIILITTLGAGSVGKGMNAARQMAMRETLAAARTQAGRGTAYV